MFWVNLWFSFGLHPEPHVACGPQVGHAKRASEEEWKAPFELTSTLSKFWDRDYTGNSLQSDSCSQPIPWLCPTFQELTSSQGQPGGHPKGLVAQLRACWQKEVASSDYRLHHQLEERGPPMFLLHSTASGHFRVGYEEKQCERMHFQYSEDSKH